MFQENHAQHKAKPDQLSPLLLTPVNGCEERMAFDVVNATSTKASNRAPCQETLQQISTTDLEHYQLLKAVSQVTIIGNSGALAI